MKKAKKHIAKQLVMQELDPGVKLSLTLTLRGDVARLWRKYVDVHSDLNPSNGQLVEALIAKGLRS